MSDHDRTGGDGGAAPLGFSTRAVRAAGRVPPVEQRPTSVPIYQTATFTTLDSAEYADVVNDRLPGYVYSRLDNPTTSALGAAVADLEGAEAGLAFASGMAAIHAAFVALASAGDRIVAPLATYGQTAALLRNVLARLGVEVAFVDATDAAAVEAALTERPTRVLHLETIANPTVVVSDIARLAGIAHRHGTTVVVDNTFASPYVCRPLALGADLVVHSATKWLSGHSDVMAGAAAGPADVIRAMRAVEIDTGATLSPFSAFLVLRGIATLAVRLERQSRSALALAAWLERQPDVVRVSYPALASHPQHDVARRQLQTGGAMLALEVAGGRAGGEAFIDALTIPERTVSLGSVHTIVAHPASTSHRQLDADGLAAAGITSGLLRCSVGLEDVEDLQRDFARGLAAVRAAASSTASSPAAGPSSAPPLAPSSGGPTRPA